MCLRKNSTNTTSQTAFITDKPRSFEYTSVPLGSWEGNKKGYLNFKI